MKLTGKLHSKLPPDTGHGQKGQWHKQNFMLESLDKYPKNFAVQAWNDLQASLDRISLGTILELDVTPESREYNGKYYTDLKVIRIGFPTKETVKVQQITPHTEIDSDEMDLPF